MASNSDTELLTEHFGYPPVSLIDDVINSVNILAERALNSVEQGLLNASPAALGFNKAAKKQQQQQQQQEPSAKVPDSIEAARTEIESGTHQLETLLCASIDRNFDKFEIYVLRNILCVRPPGVRDWMRLSHYEGLDFSTITPETTIAASPSTSTAENGEEQGDAIANPANPDAPTLEGINKLRRKLRESMRLNVLLAAESARNERLLEDLRRLVGAPSTSPAIKKESGHRSSSGSGAPPEATTADSNNDGGDGDDKSPFAFLHNKGDLKEAGPDTPLSTTAAFTLSQMQALRALSTSLRTMAPDLAVSTRKAPAAAKTRRKSRSSRSRSRSRGPSSEKEEGDDKGSGDEEEEEGEGRTGKKKSWRRERLEYVESATRRHLETVQGLELGRDGEVRDGEWQGEGRTLGRGEVEGLERVVSLLGAEDSGAAATAGKAGGTEDVVMAEGVEEGAQEEGEGEDADRMDES
ncbi:hypothetical protein SLS62_003777 [Diatrype stigma]|uniref:Kinetochore-associated protein MTW1 n=1 Tax=Diatrype stigma TaxID=117547 RepID=A0AAN9USA9_9PEZI